MKYVSLDIQYIDGTKIEAKSNRYTFVWKGSIEKYKEKLEVNHRLNALKHQAKELLMSPKGLEYCSKRPIEVEAVFGQLKSNNKLNRFTFKGL